MERCWGKFTVYGNDLVEEQIRELVEAVGHIVRQSVPSHQYRALLLIGGYGRGEGGVELCNGEYKPHNNLDFLLVTENVTGVTSASIRSGLNQQLATLEKASGIGVDLSAIQLTKLRNSPCLVMWYDMRFGHKTVLGDPDFLRSMKRFSADRVIPMDVLWLLVNRGTQLLVNDMLLAQPGLTDPELRYIIRSSMKAIIGYGDALLFFNDAYHWSYREKESRMACQSGVSAMFRSLYAEAVAFRFQPRYEDYLTRNMRSWMDELRETLECVHKTCESKRLGTSQWTWRDYPALFLRKGLCERPFSVRDLAKKSYHFLRGPVASSNSPWIERLAYRTAGHRGLLPACYPTVQYRLSDDKSRAWTQSALGAEDSSLPALRAAFLEKWGRLVDHNFPKVARKLGLPLSIEEGTV